MEPILSTIADTSAHHEPRNEPRDLLSRLYREIGISAVAAALQPQGETQSQRTTARAKREALAKTAA